MQPFGDIAKEGSRLAGAKTVSGKVQQAMMMPFAASEKFNRLWSFYSGQAAGLADGMTKESARQMGEMITMFTEFPGGVLGQSKMLRGMWSPFRQFLHFPTRYMEYLYGSLRMGPDPSKISTGILGRTLVGSTAIYEGAKNIMGVDLSGGLAMGAIPTPSYESAPFYPFPFVPPLLSLVGEGVKAVHSSDYSRLGASAMIGVPSGLAARRGFKAWSPKYADYKNRTPDGRIPTYNDKGMLIGSLTPMQMVLKGLGIRTTEQGKEQDMMQYLLTHRDKIRSYRREYLEAMSNNDLEKAQKINLEFQKKYKELGPMRIKKSDIKAIQNRKTISRLQRTMKGLPKDYRPMFQDMIGQAALGNFAQEIDNNPSGTTLLNYLE